MRKLLHALVVVGVVGTSSICFAQNQKNFILHKEVVETYAEMYGVPSGLMFGLIHTESRWNPGAKSPVGARGLTQFMPATARDLANRYPAKLFPPLPDDPVWSIHASAIYLSEGYAALGKYYKVPCNRWGATKTAYNGGRGWTIKRWEKASKKDREEENFWKTIRLINPGILESNQKENQEYPVKIYKAQFLYPGEKFCVKN